MDLNTEWAELDSSGAPVTAYLAHPAAAGSAKLPGVLAAAEYLRARPESNGQVASVGFCLGGGLSARLAAEDGSLAAAVVFYGIAPAPDLIGRIGCPVLGLYGVEDSRASRPGPAATVELAAP